MEFCIVKETYFIKVIFSGWLTLLLVRLLAVAVKSQLVLDFMNVS